MSRVNDAIKGHCEAKGIKILSSVLWLQNGGSKSGEIRSILENTPAL